jgi:hypothetical protein
MSTNRQRSNKRSREQSANVTRDNTNEPKEVEFRFLKAPKRGVKQAKQLLLFDQHIDWLELRIKKEFFTTRFLRSRDTGQHENNAGGFIALSVTFVMGVVIR